MKYVGIIPAAGLGNRLQPLPFSKEMYPIGYQSINGQLSVSPISLHLVNALKEAEVRHLYFVINSCSSRRIPNEIGIYTIYYPDYLLTRKTLRKEYTRNCLLSVHIFRKSLKDLGATSRIISSPGRL